MPVDNVLRLLDDYVAAKESEQYAIALARTYNKRRQRAYRTYIQAFDQLQKEGSLDESTRSYVATRLASLGPNTYR